jgi:hypothetical protein
MIKQNSQCNPNPTFTSQSQEVFNTKVENMNKEVGDLHKELKTSTKIN